MGHNPIADAVIRRDRNIVLAGLAAIVLVAVMYTINMAQASGDMASTMMHQHDHAPQGIDSFWSLFVMWTVMQVAMMSPTAVPMILMHTKVERSRHPDRSPVGRTTIFFLGYVIVWTTFSAVLALVQAALQSSALLLPRMAGVSPWLAGGVLVAAGLFQFSRLKEVCLSHCRSPVTYFMLEWRTGRSGALLMGLKHGLYCAGCCWALMLLLFVAGVMNLLWMAVITALVLIEKVLPNGALIGRIAGAGMVIWGIGLIVLG